MEGAISIPAAAVWSAAAAGLGVIGYLFKLLMAEKSTSTEREIASKEKLLESQGQNTQVLSGLSDLVKQLLAQMNKGA